MPVPQRHRDRFYSSDAWRAYRDYLSSKIAAAGGGFVDASDWLEDEHFEDPIHANVIGAKVFSERLANHICNRGEAGAQP